MNWSHLLFGFQGRINRAKWWLAVLVVAILNVIVEIVDKLVNAPVIVGVLYFAVLLLGLWISLASGAKRLHDRDNSAAWLWLLYGLPVLVALIVLGLIGTAIFNVLAAGQIEQSEAALMQAIASYGVVFLIASVVVLAIAIWGLVWLGCLRGTMGPNRFGPDALGGDGHPYGDPTRQQPYPPQGLGQPPASDRR